MNQATNPRVRVSGQLFAGLVLAGLGILFTLDNLHIVPAREVLRYWPVVLMLFGVSVILQARSIGGMVAGSIWLLFGAVLLGERLNLVSNAFRFWPLLLVGIGLYVVYQSVNRKPVPGPLGESSERLSAIAVLGGVDRRVTAANFQGADITAFMGGGKIDLRESTLASGSEAVIDVTTIMGGFELKVPETWNVIVDIIPFMGGYEDKTRHPTDPSAPRLRLRGFVMMGGVEIKN